MAHFFISQPTHKVFTVKCRATEDSIYSFFTTIAFFFTEDYKNRNHKPSPVDQEPKKPRWKFW